MMKTYSPKSSQQAEFEEVLNPINNYSSSNNSTSIGSSSLSPRKHVYVTAYQPDKSASERFSKQKLNKSSSSASSSSYTKSNTDFANQAFSNQKTNNTCDDNRNSLSENTSIPSKVNNNSMQPIPAKPSLSKSSSAPPVYNDDEMDSEFDEYATASSSSLFSSSSSSSSSSYQSQTQAKSIFSSKKKRSIVYNARPWQKEHEESAALKASKSDLTSINNSSSSKPGLEPSDGDLMPPPKTCGITRSTPSLLTSKSFPQTSSSSSKMGEFGVKRKLSESMDLNSASKCNLVRDVKEAHECQERGEEQTLLDDIEYLIEGMRPSSAANARALSTCSLITKCLEWNFRRKLRNPKILGCILRNMADVGKDATLSFCVAVFLYVLTRNADARFFDRATLRLLLQLLKMNSGPLLSSIRASSTKPKDEIDNEKIRAKLMQIMEDFHKSICGKTTSINQLCKHLRLNRQLNISDLLMELLISLTQRKNAEIFKNELRLNGALDCVSLAIISAIDYIGNDLGPQQIEESVLERLKKIFYYLRLLEDITFKNNQNKLALVNFQQRALLDALIRCLRFCINNISHNTVENDAKRVLLACLTSIFRLFLNISCDNEQSSDRLGGCPHLLQLTVYTALKLTETSIDDSSRTDMYVISLGLLVNLAEYCTENRARIMHLKVCLSDYNNEEESNNSEEISAIQGLVNLFVRLEKSIQEHEFEKPSDEIATENPSSPSSYNNSSSSACSSQSNKTTALKFHLVDSSATSAKKIKLFSSDDLNNIGQTEEDFDGEDGGVADIRGADVEFETNSHEEREHLQQQLTSAEIHMKHSIICAYIALLLGCILQDNVRYASRIRQLLPDGNFRVLAYMLAKLYNFLQLTEAMDEVEQKSVMKIVNVLELQDGTISSKM